MDGFQKRLFVGLSAVLWLTFLLLDLARAPGSTWVKFAAICLCCAAALAGAQGRDGALVAAALCLTVAADYFLLVRDERYTLGVCLFLAVQILYACRLYALRSGPGRLFPLRLALFALWGLLLLAEPSLFLLWCVLLYFLNLCLNAAEALALGRTGRVFAWGLLLFICCDVCVGLWNIAPFLPDALAEFSRVGMWLFYLPSQVLIVLSQSLEGSGAAA